MLVTNWFSGNKIFRFIHAIMNVFTERPSEFKKKKNKTQGKFHTFQHAAAWNTNSLGILLCPRPINQKQLQCCEIRAFVPMKVFQGTATRDTVIFQVKCIYVHKIFLPQWLYIRRAPEKYEQRTRFCFSALPVEESELFVKISTSLQAIEASLKLPLRAIRWEHESLSVCRIMQWLMRPAKGC